jgi:hypothetical protein
LLQARPLRKALQYLVVPKHALMGLPFHMLPSSILMQRSASSGRLNVTYALPVGPCLASADAYWLLRFTEICAPASRQAAVGN